MSGDSLSTFGPSDSGFLDAFLPSPTGANSANAKPQQSRVGENTRGVNTHGADDPTVASNPLCSDPLSGDPRPHGGDRQIVDGSDDTSIDSEWVFDSDPPALTDSEINRLLTTVPLPSDYLSKLRQAMKLQ